MADPPSFADDDGSADPALRAALAAGRVDLSTLHDARLLLALLPGEDDAMAVVSMVNADGERGLLAFTGLDALAAWNPEARPVPTIAAQAAALAVDEGMAALVIDVLGPTRSVLRGEALTALAQWGVDSPGP